MAERRGRQPILQLPAVTIRLNECCFDKIEKRVYSNWVCKQTQLAMIAAETPLPLDDQLPSPKTSTTRLHHERLTPNR